MNRRKALKQTSILLGGALSASVIAGVMSGCQPTYDLNWQPKFLTKNQAIMVGELAETILPETDTKGAKSLHVDEYIDLVLNDCFTGYEQLQFQKGLAELDKECQFFVNKNFLDASPEECQKFLTLLEKKGKDAQKETGKKPFIVTLKELVVTGYFTSEYAITEMLNYNPLPQKFEGCIDANADTKVQIGIQGRSA